MRLSFSRYLWIGLYLACLNLLGIPAFQAQSTIDTLICGDTLTAFYDPIQGGAATDSFYVWLGNCQQVVRFDFTTADIPDGADIYYLDLAGNMTFAGSMPYFGGNCTGPNYFSNPLSFPPLSTLDPNNCLPGFVEIYGKGIPMEDSIVRRLSLPSDFMLSGNYLESARLHLDVPIGMVAVLFVVKYNPTAYTVLNAIWDCTPQCCIAAMGDTVCIGDSIFLGTDREALGYQWTGPNGFSSTAKSPILPNATLAAEGWYKVEGSYLFGCVGTDSVFVKVNGLSISVSPPISSVCPGDSVQLSASGASSYQWLSQNGSLNATGSNVWVSPLDSMLIGVIGTDVDGCADSTIATVLLQELTVQLQGQNPTCQGANNGSLTASVQGGQAPFQIRLLGGNWQPGLTLNNLPSGNYQVEVIDASGCSAISTGQLTDPAPLSLLPIGIDPACSGGADGSISTSLSGGVGPFQIRIIGGSWQNGTTLTGLSAGLHFIEVQDALGCGADTSVSLNDPLPLVLTPTGMNPSCPGANDGSISVAIQNGQGPFQIRLAGGSWQAGTTISGLEAGIHFLEIQDGQGCFATTNLSLTDPPPLTATTKTTNPSCANTCDGEISLFPSGGTAPYSYRMDGVASDSSESSFCAGSYLVEIIDANGCSWSTTLGLTAPPAVSVSLQTEIPSCIDRCDGQITITASGGQAPYSYFLNGATANASQNDLCADTYLIEVVDANGCPWSTKDTLTSPEAMEVLHTFNPPSCVGDCDGALDLDISGGQAPYTFLLNGTTSTPFRNDLCAGTYEMEVLDANGCSWSSSESMNDPDPLFATLSPSDPTCTGFCDGEVIITPQGGTAPYQYHINGAPQPSATATGFCAGDYPIDIQDANGCSWTSSFSLKNPDPFEVMVATSPPSCLGACDGEAAILPFGGVAPYRYEVDGSLTDSVASALCVGDHQLQVIDANGCASTSDFEVEEGETFVIELGENLTIWEGEKAELQLSTNLPLDQVIWEDICEEDCDPELEFAPTESQIVRVRAISSSGCEATDSLAITVYQEIGCNGNVFMPNAFTPNGDGINDQFTLYANSESGIELIQRLIIYNKWGNAVFTKNNLTPNDLSAGWDGFSQGRPSPEATYSWAASFRRSNGQILDCSGSLVLIR